MTEYNDDVYINTLREEIGRLRDRADYSEGAYENLKRDHDRALERIERLQEELANESSLRIEERQELEKEFHQAVECPRCHLEFGPFSHIGIVGHIFTDEQIDAAWNMTQVAGGPTKEFTTKVFGLLGIERCEKYSDGGTKADPFIDCSNCNGKGYVVK